MKIITGLILAVGAIFVFEGEVTAQGICVIPDQRLDAIRGKVALVNPDYYVNSAEVTLTDRTEERNVIAKVKTDEKGWFEIKGVPKGKYVIVVSYSNAISLYIPLKLGRGTSSKYLHVMLGAFIGESCGGGDVEVRKH